MEMEIEITLLTGMNVGVFLHVTFLVKALATVATWIRPCVAVN